MSRQLNRLRSIVSEIEQIHKTGQKRSSFGVQLSNEAAPQALKTVVPTPAETTVAGARPEVFVQDFSAMLEAVTSSHLATFTAAISQAQAKEKMEEVLLDAQPEPKQEAVPAIWPEVSMQLKGDVTLKLQVQETQEIIEVRRRGEVLEIAFLDGKSVHLPLKSIA